MQLKEGSTLQGGKYRIIRILGQGGFGITYLAENIYFDRQVAIKEFFPKDFCGRDNTSHLTHGTQNNAETVTKLKARFLKEARNIAKLDHPGIIKIHDIFEENSTAYYVMDYIEGENLNEMVKRNGALPEAKAVDYITKIGYALEYIHTRNMTHFDVKPANIVVRRSDDEPILIDFGLSKQYNKSGDATSTLMQGVSQGYSPIELYNPGSIATFSPQTDVYSLAATLYYLVTGTVPPSAAQVLEDGLSFPSDISPVVRSAIESGMSTSRSKRPESIAAFLIGLINRNAANPSTDYRYNYANETSHTDINEDTWFVESQQSVRQTIGEEVKTTSASESLKNTNSSENTISRSNNVRKDSERGKIDSNSWIVIAGCIIVIATILIMIIGNRNSLRDEPKSFEIKTQNEQKSVPDSVYNEMIDTTNGRMQYSGAVDNQGKPHGFGSGPFFQGAGQYYSGYWEHGKMEGKAYYRLKNGDEFEGYFKNDEYDKGRYTVKSTGEYFEGTYQNGQPYKGFWRDKKHNILETLN